MTEIEWLDGRVTKVPELALGDAFGESVQAELDFGFDDVLEGLWVEVRHHEPDEDSDGDRAGGAAHCTRTAGTAWSNRRTSTVSSASFTRGSRGSAARGGARAPRRRVNAAAVWEFGMGAGSETPAEGRTRWAGTIRDA